MRTAVLGQIPDSDTPTMITTDDLALVWVDNHIVDWRVVVVAALNGAGARFPDLHCSILGASNHPLSLAMECNAGDVVGMAFECQDGIWVRGLDIVQLDAVVACGGKKALVRGDTEAVDLGVRMLDCTRAYPGKSLPEPAIGYQMCSCLRLPLCRRYLLTEWYGHSQL